jgi:hypothetical protein
MNPHRSSRHTSRRTARPPWTDAQIDAVLSADDSIYPSSGFTESVMSAVGRESAAPAPFPFPWRRALPGLAAIAAALLLLLAVVISALRLPAHAAAAASAAASPMFAPMVPQLLPILGHAPTLATLAVTFSVGITVAALLLCRRLLSGH